MSELPQDLKYSKSHEWVRSEADGTITVGITHHAQQQLGDLVFVELPEVGASVEAEGESGVVESVKAASDLFSPVAGEIAAVNDQLADSPELVNESPYGKGWIFRLKPANSGDLDALLDATAYAAFVEDE
jgi:glycine cleavage system H protein